MWGGYYEGWFRKVLEPWNYTCILCLLAIHNIIFWCSTNILPYSDKRKQLLKMTFLVNEQNGSVMYNVRLHSHQCNSSLYLDLNIFQQDECFCPKLGIEVENAKSNLKTSLSQIWVICQLLPFVRVGQHTDDFFVSTTYIVLHQDEYLPWVGINWHFKSYM